MRGKAQQRRRGRGDGKPAVQPQAASVSVSAMSEEEGRFVSIVDVTSESGCLSDGSAESGVCLEEREDHTTIIRLGSGSSGSEDEEEPDGIVQYLGNQEVRILFSVVMVHMQVYHLLTLTYFSMEQDSALTSQSENETKKRSKF